MINNVNSLNSRQVSSGAADGRPFQTIIEALESLGDSDAGYFFHDVRGTPTFELKYRQLPAKAQELAAKLSAHFPKGSRIGLVAETSPDFITTFFACQYAGLIPAPMPLPVNLGGKDGYLQQIRQMAQSSGASGLIGPDAILSYLSEAGGALPDLKILGYGAVRELSGANDFTPFTASDDCYIQFSSGSTSQPKGVVGSQSSVSANLHAITANGLRLTTSDRAVSWLPLYHDMGLIGFCLAPMYAGISVDYLATSDFVRRPLMWLRLITRSKATVTYSPSFGYELAAKRAARAEEGAIDLSCLKIAGIGADMVRPEALNAFADAFLPFGFDKRAFLPSYGMAEATLAISFSALGEGYKVDRVDMRHVNRSGTAQPASAVTPPSQERDFVVCGKPLPGHELSVRGEDGTSLPDRAVGKIFIKGPSLTPGYFRNETATEAIYDGEWLDTGDMGYTLNGEIVITGRAKDLIIINGRNIWPQDIEWAVEATPGARKNGVAAFSVDQKTSERIVVVVERRGGMTSQETDDFKRSILNAVQTVAGAPAEVVLARPHSMVLTSSGKLSRAKMKAKFLEGAFAVSEPSPTPALAEARV
ncbi:MAG: fatty acyl-AMP ligase [Pseudomonadota bacterium]